MICFENRAEAGIELGKKLKEMAPGNPVVLAVAAGGIEAGRQVADALGQPLEVVISKKLYYPTEPDSVMGAIAEDGSLFISENARVNFASKVLDKLVKQEEAELKKRVDLFRSERPFPDLKGKTALIIDEGIVTPAAIIPLIECCRKNGAGEVWVASPVGGEYTSNALSQVADKVVVLKYPKFWTRIEDCYANYRKLPKDELRKLLG